MPTKQGKSPSQYWKNDLTINQAANTGVDATSRRVQDGAGNNTAIAISDDNLIIQPVNDDTVNTLAVATISGSHILRVDTANLKVLVGASQVAANTQYAYFGNDYATGAGFSADVHFAIPFNNSPLGSSLSNAMGTSTTSSFNDTDPSASASVSTNAHTNLITFWYVPDNITIDAVYWFHGADTATGDSTAAHLMAYTVDTDNGSSGGDLSSGTVVADGATITKVADAGYEQIYYQSMTIQSADVDAGKVILFTFASDTINSDYTIHATVKYHIR